ncbi:rCG61334 [Rattus norvegicus]|uniref:RCG61334 n=1 Tax=Rattus norvegicus TaxID=10116 RepID=A6HAA5_RAT|nr:rCG61334 [Rattus norvegicus]
MVVLAQCLPFSAVLLLLSGRLVSVFWCSLRSPSHSLFAHVSVRLFINLHQYLSGAQMQIVCSFCSLALLFSPPCKDTRVASSVKDKP